MNPTTTLVSAVALSGIVGAAVSLALAPVASPALGPAASPDVLAGLAQSVAELEREHARLADALEELRAAPAGALRDERLPRGELEAIVAELLAAHADEPARAAPSEAETDGGFDKQALFDRLLSGEVGDEEAQRLWKQLAEHGAAEELVEAFEARVEADPNDPDARVDLGVAYLQRIQEVGNGPLAGVYATRADASFDAALELDERHWDARFHKAVALSFWPPVFGKQGAAIQQFEVLVQQQAGGVPEPGYAQTHLLLGNLYAQMGQLEKARAAWQHGAELYPGFEPLQEQLEVHSQP